MKQKSAFTLIELLIVVAIIAILAAIAVPNFLEAQVRSKVSRVASDMRSMATAIESYRIDNQRYIEVESAGWWGPGLTALTTPVAYMTTLPVDPFLPSFKAGHIDLGTYGYQTALFWRQRHSLLTWDYVHIDYAYYTSQVSPTLPWTDPYFKTGAVQDRTVEWELNCYGPNVTSFSPFGWDSATPYDPSNGTVSAGDICRYKP